jgi:hypothetical protein
MKTSPKEQGELNIRNTYNIIYIYEIRLAATTIEERHLSFMNNLSFRVLG